LQKIPKMLLKVSLHHTVQTGSARHHNTNTPNHITHNTPHQTTPYHTKNTPKPHNTTNHIKSQHTTTHITHHTKPHHTQHQTTPYHTKPQHITHNTQHQTTLHHNISHATHNTKPHHTTPHHNTNKPHQTTPHTTHQHTTSQQNTPNHNTPHQTTTKTLHTKSHHTTHHTETHVIWNDIMLPCMTSPCSRVRIHSVGNIIQDKVSRIPHRISVRTLAMAADIHKIINMWRELRAKDSLISTDTNTEQYFPYLFPCCTSRRCNTACSSSCKLVCAALLPEHHLFQAVSYVLFRSSEVTDLSQISVFVIKCSAKWNSEKMDFVVGIPLQLPYSFHRRNHVQTSRWHVLNL